MEGTFDGFDDSQKKENDEEDIGWFESRASPWRGEEESNGEEREIAVKEDNGIAKRMTKRQVAHTVLGSFANTEHQQ